VFTESLPNNGRLLAIKIEAWFRFFGHISTQMNIFLSATNPHEVSVRPLHDQKFGVHCAISQNPIMCSILFNETVYPER
jgi:hypothetical protein